MGYSPWGHKELDIAERLSTRISNKDDLGSSFLVEDKQQFNALVKNRVAFVFFLSRRNSIANLGSVPHVNSLTRQL